MSKEDGISPTVGVIVMVAITVALGVVIGTVALDLGGSTEESVQAGVDIQQTDTGEYQVQWQTAGNAEELQVLVNGSELDNATLSSPGESVTVAVSDGDTISVTGSSGDSKTQVSSTTASSGSTSTPTVTDSPETTLSSSTSGDTYKQGSSVSVDYTVTNESDSEKDISMNLDVDNGVGQVDSTTESTVSSDETRTGSLTWSVPSGQSPGEYTLTVSGGGDTSTTVVTVEELVFSTPSDSAPSDLNQVHNNMSGSGTSADPYVITNDQELQAMRVEPNSHYELANNIDASKTDQWNSGKGYYPIQGNSGSFSGTLDGNGYVIDGLYMDRDTDYAGLIGFLDGTIKNVGIINGDFTNGGNVGGIAGDSDGGSIENVYFRGSIVSQSDEYSGGIVGTQGQGAEIRNAYTAGSVQTNGTNGASGGIAGANSCNSCGSATMENTYSSMSVSADRSDQLAAYNYGTISGSAGLSESEMKGSSAETNMSNLDFVNMWKTVSGDYPELR
jgi:FlaG/FlaF family flagellin (archaellin)